MGRPIVVGESNDVGDKTTVYGIALCMEDERACKQSDRVGMEESPLVLSNNNETKYGGYYCSDTDDIFEDDSNNQKEKKKEDSALDGFPGSKTRKKEI
eukprot:scaffold1171_cov177-Amphora_coffeaeformis.AAC.23